MTERQSIGKEAAIALAQSKWWVGRDAREVVEFQLWTTELCMDFSEFHRLCEEALGRPVYTHEFAFSDGLIAEFYGDKPRPTMEEIINLIPEDKRIVVRTHTEEE